MSTTYTPLPGRVLEVLGNLERMFPQNLRIVSANSWEVVFYVENMTDSVAIQQIRANAAQIFGDGPGISGPGCVLEPSDFQLLCDLFPQTGQRGLTLLYLPNIGDRSDYTAGIWYV